MVASVVGEVARDYVKQQKAASGNGKLTQEEKEAAKALAVKRSQQALAERNLHRTDVGKDDRLLDAAIESEVRRLKAEYDS